MSAPYHGDPNCSDCCTMSHCETHHKDEGTYPFDDAPSVAAPARTTGSSRNVAMNDVLKHYFPNRKILR